MLSLVSGCILFVYYIDRLYAQKKKMFYDVVAKFVCIFNYLIYCFVIGKAILNKKQGYYGVIVGKCLKYINVICYL